MVFGTLSVLSEINVMSLDLITSLRFSLLDTGEYASLTLTKPWQQK